MRHKPVAWERRLQILLVRRFRKYVLPWNGKLVMIANGEYRPPQTLKLLDAMGLEDGMPDLALVGGRRHPVRWIEIKLEANINHEKTNCSDVQREMHDLLTYLENQVDVVRSFEEFWDIVEAEDIPHSMGERPPRQDVMDFRRRRPRGRDQG
jgi:hypothetical protein